MDGTTPVILDPPAGLRELKKARTETEMIDAAYALVREGGLAALSAEAIADRVGVSRRTFFNYFPSVESVLVRGLTRLLTDVTRELLESVGDESILDTFDRLATSPSGAAILDRCVQLGALAPEASHAKAILNASLHDWIGWLATYLRGRDPSLDALDAAALAHCTVASAQAALTVWAECGCAPDAEGVARFQSLLTRSLAHLRDGFGGPRTGDTPS